MSLQVLVWNIGILHIVSFVDYYQKQTVKH